MTIRAALPESKTAYIQSQTQGAETRGVSQDLGAEKGMDFSGKSKGGERECKRVSLLRDYLTTMHTCGRYAMGSASLLLDLTLISGPSPPATESPCTNASMPAGLSKKLRSENILR